MPHNQVDLNVFTTTPLKGLFVNDLCYGVVHALVHQDGSSCWIMNRMCKCDWLYVNEHMPLRLKQWHKWVELCTETASACKNCIEI